VPGGQRDFLGDFLAGALMGLLEMLITSERMECIRVLVSLALGLAGFFMGRAYESKRQRAAAKAM
jgi:hypothetical protein